MSGTPQTRYARSGKLHIAYQVTGSGDFDIVVVPGWISHLEWQWEEDLYRHFMERLGSFARVIRFDKRNMGLSDRVGDAMPPLEERMDDVRAVMDAAGSQRAALIAISEGGSLSVLFAATYPERVTALVLVGASARLAAGPDYPYGFTPEAAEAIRAACEQDWGGGVTLPLLYPSGADDPAVREWWGRFERIAASPGAGIATAFMALELDARQLLPVLRVPTLVIHRSGDLLVEAGHGRYLAEHIPGARYAEFPGNDHWPWLGDAESVLGEMEEFLTGARRDHEPDRVLATVLFTDIVGSTERAAALGDHQWRAVLDEHDRLVRRELTRFRGREVKTTGDGFLATFDGPARGIRCAAAIRDGIKPVGLEVRSGLHTGEVEMRDGDVGGIAVHIGARVAALAGPGEVVVSSTVKDIVAGAGIAFQDWGEHGLKGVPGEWRLFSVTGFQ
ncbi:MAG: adenylate/guanylate cyclase domain-containing protein [Acidimicrobiia bacterium]